MCSHIQINYRIGRKLFNHSLGKGLKVETCENQNRGWILVNGNEFYSVSGVFGRYNICFAIYPYRGMLVGVFQRLSNY
jgi:hypothetical protein